MNKRIYKQTSINQISAASLYDRLSDSPAVVVAIDVAKRDMVAVVADRQGRPVTTVGWKSPQENSHLVQLMRGIAAAGHQVEVAMESSSSYGDILWHALSAAGFAVFRVAGKRTHDAKELYDGVPSLHDAKSAAIIARLHAQGISTRWTAMPAQRLALQSAVAVMDMHRQHHLRCANMLEALLARHWPEVTQLVELTAATLLAVLARIGGPSDVCTAPDKTRRLMRGMSHRLMKDEKIESVIASARTTVGIPLIPEQREALMAIARESHEALKKAKAAQLNVERLSEKTPANKLAPVVGRSTAAVLYMLLGDLSSYHSSRSVVKAMGLNLKEKSSGTLRGRLSITKRGPGRIRQYLWLAVFRWMRTEPMAQAWYDQKVKRDGGKRGRAVVALMRKLASALFHVARGQAMQTDKLFDVSRLQNLAASTAPRETT